MRLYFPRAGALGYSVCFTPLCSSRFICAQVWGRGVLPTALPALLSATLSPALSVYLCECGAAGSASGQTACPISPTLCQSRSRHGNVSPPRTGCQSLPLLPVWMNVYFLFPWCRTSLPFNFLSVLVVRGGAVCLPMPPSWFFALVGSYMCPDQLSNPQPWPIRTILQPTKLPGQVLKLLIPGNVLAHREKYSAV